MALFRWIILRRLRQEPVRTGLTSVGIALGVGVVLAVQLANASALGGFRAALDAVAGRTSLEIAGPGVGVSEQTLASLGWLRDWGQVSPVIEGDALGLFGGTSREAVRVLGIDILVDQPFREYRLSTGGSAGRPAAQRLLALLVDPGSVMVPAALARRHGLSVDSELKLAIGDRVETFHVRALLADDGPARVLDGNFVLMDIAAAQLAFDRLGRVDRVDLLLDDPSRLDEAERAIAARLPGGLHVQRPARRGAQVEAMLAAFQFNLTALSSVALLVGLFLVYNTVATSVIARRAEIGVLRAIGTRRRTVLALFLGEALALAVPGCALGVAFGWLLARVTVAFTSSTVTTLYVSAAAATPSLQLWQVATAFGVGIPLALAAAAAPALEAAAISPLDAIRQAARVAAGRRPRTAGLAGAAVCLAVAAWASTLGPIRGLPVAGFGAALLVVFGLALLAPAALYLVGRLASPLGRLLGIEARLAARNVGGDIPRLAVSVAALAVSLGMLVAIAILIGSFRQTVIYWVGQTLQADLFVATGRRSNLDEQPTISDALDRAIASDPDVAAIDRFRSLNLPYRDRLIVVSGGDFSVLLARTTLVFKEPANGRHAMRDAIGRDEVVVSESFAIRFDANVGDRITLSTPGGTRVFRVAAVYFDYSTDRGVVAMDRSTFTRIFGPLRPTSLTVYLRPGRNPEQVRDRLLARLGPEHRVFIHTNASLRAEVLRIFDATFAITYGLEAIAIVVALLGITATLITLAIERRGELLLLRLVGAGAGQMRKMIAIESALLGVAGEALGLVAGLALSVILVYVINVQSFGWTIQFHLPIAFLVQAAALLLATTTLAGAFPARRVSRLDVGRLGQEE